LDDNVLALSVLDAGVECCAFALVGFVAEVADVDVGVGGDVALDGAFGVVA
jgi:hypothetical protein